MDEELLPDDLILLNCAQCEKPMVRACDVPAAKQYGLLVMGARLRGRPYCRGCHAIKSPSFSSFGIADGEDDNPWHSNAVRALEDGIGE